MDRFRRHLLKATAGAACVAALPAVPAIAGRAPIRVLGGRAFGSYWRLVLPASTDARPARQAVGLAIASIDRAFSPFRADSEISRFNAAHTRGWMAVDAEVARVIAEGLRIARLTGGAFDPSVGPIVGRLGFGPITGPMRGSYRGFTTGEDAIRKSDPRLTFDPCGIAKGYALDRVAVRLDALGFEAYLLEIGGEVVTRGTHPDGRSWRVGIERPEPRARTVERIVHPDGMALATSGDWINGYTIGVRRYCHIIDPASRAPVDGKVASVSVIAPRAMTADALATGLMVMGPRRGLRLAAQLGLPVLYLLRRAGSLEEAASPAFARYVTA